MMFAESLLNALAKRFSQRNMGQSREMTEALTDDRAYADYRARCLDKVLDAARQYKVEWRDQDVLDLGCYDGAISRGYLDAGARSVIGIDIDEPAVSGARSRMLDMFEYVVGENCVESAGQKHFLLTTPASTQFSPTTYSNMSSILLRFWKSVIVFCDRADSC